MRDLVEIHSDLFGRNHKRIATPKKIPHSVQFNRSLPERVGRRCESPPPLAQSSNIKDDFPLKQQGIRTRSDANSIGISPSELQLAAYTHHCKHAFMRSQLSRLYVDKETDIRGGRHMGEPTVEDLICIGDTLSDEELDQFLNILKLRIRNRYMNHFPPVR